MMAGRIIVETPQNHAAWLMRNANPAAAGLQLPPASAGNEAATVAEVQR
jgi:heme/copper-type cytochrome/quinol oxidase subunit 2